MIHVHYFLQVLKIVWALLARGCRCLHSPSCREGSFSEINGSKARRVVPQCGRIQGGSSHPGSPDTEAHVCLVAWICINRLRLATRTRRVSRSVHHAESRGLSVGFCWVSTGEAPPPPPAQTAPLPLRSRLSTWLSTSGFLRFSISCFFNFLPYFWTDMSWDCPTGVHERREDGF